MKRNLYLSLIALLIVGCGQAEAPADVAASTSPAPATSTPAPAASTSTANSAAASTSSDAPAAAPSTAATGGNRVQLAQVDLGAVEAAGFVEGEHYQKLPSATAPAGTTADSVEVNEFFMYSCIHCYNLEPFVQAWKEDMPDFVNLVQVPTTWDEYRVLHARAYYAAKSLGVLEDVHLPFFRQIHDSGDYLESPAGIAALFSRFDVSAEDLEDALNDFSVTLEVNRANELGSRYNIQSTPAFVVNGKYLTDVSSAGGSPERLFELIELLAAAELGL